MYNRNYANRGGIRQEFIDGVDSFIAYVCQLPSCIYEGTLRCPCAKCKCQNLVTPETVKYHLYRYGFKPNY